MSGAFSTSHSTATPLPTRNDLIIAYKPRSTTLRIDGRDLEDAFIPTFRLRISGEERRLTRSWMWKTKETRSVRLLRRGGNEVCGIAWLRWMPVVRCSGSTYRWARQPQMFLTCSRQLSFWMQVSDRISTPADQHSMILKPSILFIKSRDAFSRRIHRSRPFG